MQPQALNFRLCFFMSFLFLGLGVQLPFLPLWLADRGLTTAEIAAVLSGQIIIRTFGAPLGAFLADRYKRPVPLIRLFPVLCAASYLLLSFMQGFEAIFLVAALASVFLSPVGPIAENFAIVESAKAGLDYGKQRLWASVSFIIGTLVSGFALEWMPTSAAVLLISVSYAALGLAAFALPDLKPQAGSGQSGTRAGPGDVLKLFRSRIFVIFLLAVSMAQASHALLYGFGSLHWEDLGHSKATIGILWGIGVVAEVVFFFFSGRLIPAFAPIVLILIGCLAGMFRWTATAFDPALWLLMPLQVLHALTFALTHFGTLHFLMQNVPGHLRNSAQGLYAACSAGLFMMLATAAAGPLFGAFAGRAYLAMAAMSLVAGGLAFIVMRISPTRPGVADASGSPHR
jgi:MFS transporter, PPP family, 3-phenylpropionic acid transporter